MNKNQYFKGPSPSGCEHELKTNINNALDLKNLKHSSDFYGYYDDCYYYFSAGDKLLYIDYKPDDMEEIPFQQFVDWVLDITPKEVNYEIY